MGRPAHEDEQERSVGEHPVIGERSGQLGQHAQDHGARDGPTVGADAAQDEHAEDGDREGEAEVARRDEGQVVRVEASCESGQRGPEGEGHDLERAHVHARGVGGVLVLSRRQQRQPRPRVEEPEVDGQREQHTRHHQDEEAGLAEGRAEPARGGDAADPEGAAEEGEVKEDRHHDEVDTHRGDGEEVLAHADGRRSDERARASRRRHRRDERGPEVPAVAHREDGGGVGADAEKGGVAEGDLPRDARDGVEPERQDAVDPHQGGDGVDVHASDGGAT